jgi:hypothetical protein
MNRKRVVLLLVAIALLAGMAPEASASHCLRCKIWMGSWSECIPAINFWNGWTECVDSGTEPVCWYSGTECVAHGSALLPLETEFTVASVERLDEPAKDADETRVAAAGLPQPATR